ncbi:MAG: class I SAM-dependent methyltransferase [Pseudomonadota bacterium]
MGLSFAADWLALREPADHRARASAVTEAMIGALAHIPSPRIVDLGCGRGSNLRYLALRLPTSARYLLVDGDEGLLAAAAASAPPGPTVTTLRADLRDLDPATTAACADLLAMAALVDLVDEAWLDRWIEAAAAHGAALLVTGNVDGRVMWEPAVDGDGPIMAAFVADQRRDKGFGPSLADTAPRHLEARLRAAGWRLAIGEADWHLADEADAPLQHAYLEGVVAALRGGDAVDDVLLGWWSRQREAAIVDGTSVLRVGHVDLFGDPPSR